MKAMVSVLLLLLAVLACVVPAAEAQVGRDLLTRMRRERRGREYRPRRERRERRPREYRPRRERRPRGSHPEEYAPGPFTGPTVTTSVDISPIPAPTVTGTVTGSIDSAGPTVTSTTAPGPTSTGGIGGCPSILDLVEASEDLSTLGMAIQAAELTPLFSNATAELTVLAPTNAAFDAIPAEALQALVEDRDALVAILGLHVIEGVVLAEDLSGSTEVGAVTGPLGVSAGGGGGVTFTGPDGGSSASVIEADIMSCAGVVHKLDAVIVPGTPAETETETETA